MSTASTDKQGVASLIPDPPELRHTTPVAFGRLCRGWGLAMHADMHANVEPVKETSGESDKHACDALNSTSLSCHCFLTLMRAAQRVALPPLLLHIANSFVFAHACDARFC